MDNDLDLVDEMEWEDSDKVEFITLEEAGLESNDYDTVSAAQSLYYNEEGNN